jgi:hypothetical protein
VDATADFQFSLFDAASAGNLIAGPTSVSNVDVIEGLFAVEVDFGPVEFNGQARWLEIASRTPAGSGTFTTLTPRQPLTAAPYARFAVAAPWTGLTGVPAGFADGIDNGSGDGHSLDAADGSPVDALFVDNAGDVGVGTTAPLSKLHVNGGFRWGGTNFARSDQDGLGLFLEQVGSSSATSNIRLQTSKSGDLSNYSLFSIVPNSGFSFTSLGTGNSNVGIGTSSPATSLHVNGQSLWLTGGNGGGFPAAAGAGLRIYMEGGNRAQIFSFDYATSTPRDIALQEPGGRVGIGTSSPATMLDVNGTTRTKVLEITGADLAEKFPATEQIEPGMVVAIDPTSPGRLCLARGAYNRCVAGVVSGANNFSAGAILGNLPGHEDAPPVALSGRVYVWCDSTGGGIEPGDLLTTSDTPGHAMKATDHARSQGAVLGKAMSPLPSGCGLVLVLVSLQ